MDCYVTPFTGVWIEIYMSIINKITILVTPFTGVWIEIDTLKQLWHSSYVTPFTGVWIEITNKPKSKHKHPSHTLHGCVD